MSEHGDHRRDRAPRDPESDERRRRAAAEAKATAEARAAAEAKAAADANAAVDAKAVAEAKATAEAKAKAAAAKRAAKAAKEAAAKEAAAKEAAALQAQQEAAAKQLALKQHQDKENRRPRSRRSRRSSSDYSRSRSSSRDSRRRPRGSRRRRSRSRDWTRSRSRSRRSRRSRSRSYRRRRSRSRRSRSRRSRSRRSHYRRSRRDRSFSRRRSRRRSRSPSRRSHRTRDRSYLVEKRSQDNVVRERPRGSRDFSLDSSSAVSYRDRVPDRMEEDRRIVVRDYSTVGSRDSGSEGDFSEDYVEDLEASSRYAKRLLLVNDICDLNIEPVVNEEERTFFDSRETVGLIHLPPAEGFVGMMNNFMKDVKGKKGSKRARTDHKLPLDVGKWPQRNRPNLSTVEPAGNPWIMTASLQNSSLTSSQSFNCSAPPKVVVDQDKVRMLESSAREEFSISSYNTWFLQASRLKLDSIQEKLGPLSKKPKMKEEDWAELWQDLQEVQGLTEAAGIGTKKLAENLVSDIGSLLLLRRDAWLRKFLDNKVISKQDAWDLRHSDFNEAALFNQEELEKVHDRAQKRESDTMTKKLLESSIKSKQGAKSSVQPFRGGPSGSQPRPFSGPSNRGGAAATFGRGRGGRNRGGRGRGKVNPFRQDFSSGPSGSQQSGGKDK